VITEHNNDLTAREMVAFPVQREAVHSEAREEENVQLLDMKRGWRERRVSTQVTHHLIV
jgi:hypothetical protein